MSERGLYLLEADAARQIYIKEDPELGAVGHFHEGLEIVALLEGEVEAFHITKKVLLKAGEIFFADSFECHHYHTLSPTVKAVVIVLSSEYTTVYREMYVGQTLPFHLRDVEKNRPIIDLMRVWLAEKEKSFMLNVGYCNLLLSRLVEAYPMERREEKKDKNVSVKLLKYINDHYIEDISLTQVAKRIGYTKEYCSKIFAEVVGMSFRDYLNFLRMKKANEYFSMKKELRLTTTEIVYKCGFNSTATFYRVLKSMKKKNIKI